MSGAAANAVVIAAHAQNTIVTTVLIDGSIRCAAAPVGCTTDEMHQRGVRMIFIKFWRSDQVGGGLCMQNMEYHGRKQQVATNTIAYIFMMLNAIRSTYLICTLCLLCIRWPRLVCRPVRIRIVPETKPFTAVRPLFSFTVHKQQQSQILLCQGVCMEV